MTLLRRTVILLRKAVTKVHLLAEGGQYQGIGRRWDLVRMQIPRRPRPRPYHPLPSTAAVTATAVPNTMTTTKHPPGLGNPLRISRPASDS